MGFAHRAGWCRPEKASFASPVDGRFREAERPLDRGWDPEVELAEHAKHGQSESQSAGGVAIPHRAGKSRVDKFQSRHMTLSCPGDAYFVYESCPMRDQTKLANF